MPQVLRVVRCFQCHQFQSDIVKKSNKWTCVRCNTKQTLRKEYGRGSGQQCRLLAQQLSSKTCETEDLLDRTLVDQLLQDDFQIPTDEPSVAVPGETKEAGTSKWGMFLKKDEPEEATSGFFKDINPLPQSSNFQNSSLESVKITIKDSPAINRPPQPARSNFSKPKVTYHVEEPPPAKTQSIPLMDFHQMNRQDKKQFKWEARRNFNSSRSSDSGASPKQCSAIEELPKSQQFFSFKPKAPKSFNRKQPEEKLLPMKRELDELESRDEAGHSKMFKVKNNEGLEVRANGGVSEVNSESQLGSSGTSKWSKFVVKSEEDDGIIRPS